MVSGARPYYNETYMAYIFYDDDANGRIPESVDAREKASALVKLVSLFGFAIVFVGFLVIRGFTNRVTVASTSIRNSFGSIEYTTPYKNVLYENFGFVSEPKITLPLKTTQGYKDTTFLLDSGAVVSALPLQAAHDTGIDLTTSRRITLQGFSGVPSFAYLDSIVVKIADQDFTFPAVFTESTKTSYILGRKGFFDEFSISFDHVAKTLTISTSN